MTERAPSAACAALGRDASSSCDAGVSSRQRWRVVHVAASLRLRWLQQVEGADALESVFSSARLRFVSARLSATRDEASRHLSCSVQPCSAAERRTSSGFDIRLGLDRLSGGPKGSALNARSDVADPAGGYIVALQGGLTGFCTTTMAGTRPAGTFHGSAPDLPRAVNAGAVAVPLTWKPEKVGFVTSKL